jgi:hypothetical protein
MATARKSRAGSKFHHGDDLTKTGADRKRVSRTEPWEAKRSGGSSRSSGGTARSSRTSRSGGAGASR